MMQSLHVRIKKDMLGIVLHFIDISGVVVFNLCYAVVNSFM